MINLVKFGTLLKNLFANMHLNGFLRLYRIQKDSFPAVPVAGIVGSPTTHSNTPVRLCQLNEGSALILMFPNSSSSGSTHL
jgi:fluoride ion exporter CrcB/FEX